MSLKITPMPHQVNRLSYDAIQTPLEPTIMSNCTKYVMPHVFELVSARIRKPQFFIRGDKERSVLREIKSIARSLVKANRRSPRRMQNCRVESFPSKSRLISVCKFLGMRYMFANRPRTSHLFSAKVIGDVY